MGLLVERKEINDVAEYIKNHYEELKRKFSYSYFSRYGCRGRETFEEIFHETLITGIKKSYQRNPEGRKENWLRSIFRTTAINYLIRNVNRNPYQISQYRNGDGGSLDPDFFPHNDGDPLKNIIAKEEREIVNKNINNGNPLDSEVIELYYFQKYKIKEISEILNAPIGTIKRRLFVARKRLGKRLIDRI